MFTVAGLRADLEKCANELGKIQILVDRLRSFTPYSERDGQDRVSLGVDIHADLTNVERELELLLVDVEALDTGSDNRRKLPTTIGEKEAENERVVAMAGRLADDLKKTRVGYRNAQLQALKAEQDADLAKQREDFEQWKADLSKPKEQESVLSKPQSPERRPQPSEKFTQDDMVLNASNDVTAALRRTHHLMQAELSRSQFAQETLEQSTAAISSLSESYSSLDTLLTSSRSLANSLLRSQKSDTWYLETTFYILLGTIAWLLFRRVLYGPLWWLAWLPFKLVLRFVFAALGAVGLSSTKSIQPSPNPIASGISETLHQTAAAVSGSEVPTNNAAWEEQPSAQEKEDRLIDKIGKMMDSDSKDEGTNIDDISPEERKRQEELPRNPKKRMYEAEEPVRDEL
ncbi:uncharacterized protein N7459_000317 [Penicillium hispanicum]|uniref:uncharacterized protein n=1 Tax=Penicillium hispanicum TaxID=1080232 RepID=UPI00253F8B8F|nr:uncharacterized protein N7459_000317 [Penicillium hispanicum]KAJ5594109.1 hypothetical protein N7459_000317 [Penicillium hispanicum]